MKISIHELVHVRIEGLIANFLQLLAESLAFRIILRVNHFMEDLASPGLEGFSSQLITNASENMELIE